MKVHKLKLDSSYYDDSAAGIKTFEIRKNDRNYQVGDVLELREWVWSALGADAASLSTTVDTNTTNIGNNTSAISTLNTNTTNAILQFTNKTVAVSA